MLTYILFSLHSCKYTKSSHSPTPYNRKANEVVLLHLAPLKAIFKMCGDIKSLWTFKFHSVSLSDPPCMSLYTAFQGHECLQLALFLCEIEILFTDVNRLDVFFFVCIIIAFENTMPSIGFLVLSSTGIRLSSASEVHTRHEAS